ncbi:hypothetical protein [Streptomyces sp. Amel2xB2]|uniref:hypothetical protein n=1 Tax=Streptomyces sp. Amel2xB2 TaxID=1305829 RepID=UPI0011B9380D|nr:hypothetical protein [Streptomyces sp. Amel2xB2]
MAPASVVVMAEVALVVDEGRVAVESTRWIVVRVGEQCTLLAAAFINSNRASLVTVRNFTGVHPLGNCSVYVHPVYGFRIPNAPRAQVGKSVSATRIGKISPRGAAIGLR